MSLRKYFSAINLGKEESSCTPAVLQDEGRVDIFAGLDEIEARDLAKEMRVSFLST